VELDAPSPERGTFEESSEAVEAVKAVEELDASDGATRPQVQGANHEAVSTNTGGEVYNEKLYQEIMTGEPIVLSAEQGNC